MTRAKWDNFVYENSKGVQFKVKNEADLDARLIQDIMLCNIRREPLETESWLLRFVERSEPEFRADMDAALERVKRYIDPSKNHVEVMWEKHVIPEPLAERVMGFLAAEEIYIKPPPYVDHGP